MSALVGRDPIIQYLCDQYKARRLAEIERIKRDHSKEPMEQKIRRLNCWEDREGLSVTLRRARAVRSPIQRARASYWRNLWRALLGDSRETA